MEDIKSFDDFYDEKLSPYLESLGGKGESTRIWEVISIISGIAIVPVFAYGLSGSSGVLGGFLVLIDIVVTVVSVYQYTKAKENYESDYKEKIIQQIIKFINPGLEYKPDICIHHTDYINSSLCRGWYDDYDGDDWIGGNYKGVNFKCSELNVTRRGGGRNSEYTIYKGLFFVAPLNVAFSGGTYVWIKGNEQLAVSIAEERYRMFAMPEVVRVDCRNGEFEKDYVVYTTDVYEASSLIDEQMMKAITKFKKQIKRDITLSFVAGVCYVSIPFNENLFEPDRSDPGNKEEIKKCFFTVLLILSIINQLQLDKM